tara:strand:- start:3922 stop:4269 length:348 start_codon:yes stop_codon:yes gene_type:complete
MENLNDVIIIINKVCNTNINNIEEIDGMVFQREIFLNDELYTNLINEIKILKNIFNTSELNCLHKNAKENQRWPLLNLMRQILKSLNYKMVPKRICDGYKNGKKQFKRLFIIESI